MPLRQSDKLDKVLEFAARMDERHKALSEDVKAIAHSVETLGGRVSILETFKNRVLGYASGASVGVTAIYHIASSFFRGHQ
jgi:CRISPR/Cas system-associated protein Csm6